MGAVRKKGVASFEEGCILKPKHAQKIVRDDSAVSPVIGVILMVAITVVLAAVVFVLVSDSGSDASNPPNASFQTDRSGTGGEIRVVKIAQGPIDVTDLQVTGQGSCPLFAVNGTAKSSGNLAAGDYWDCDTDGTTTIVHGSSDTLLYREDL